MTGDIYDIVGGAFAVDLLMTLQDRDALDLLAEPRHPSEIAAVLSGDKDMIRGALDFLAATTSIVVALDAERFQLAARYRTYNSLGFQLDKFMRAYGPAVSSLGRPTSTALSSGIGVDAAALANAFARRTSAHPSLTARIIRAWPVEGLVDLGCGAGSVLIELARADPTFRGWGIDVNSSMVEAAQARAHEAGVADQVQFVRGGVHQLATLVPRVGFDEAALHARSLLNEFFADGPAAATEVVATIRDVFAGRLLFVEDYYGRLGTSHGGDFRHSHLQDLVQVASGQGIPPDGFEGWAALYEAAGCSVLHRYEGHDDGVAWFVHVVLLGSSAAG
ncbi:MAG TPA: class I SAM-dependent methyltransferase [Ornithinibacter sp.]|nr:class I SAM-dependent methyltransferase [Ornithinibacter sp.]